MENKNREGFGVGAILTIVAIIAVVILIISLSSDSPILEMVGGDRQRLSTEEVMDEVTLLDPVANFGQEGTGIKVGTYRNATYVSAVVVIEPPADDHVRYQVVLVDTQGESESLGDLTYNEETRQWILESRVKLSEVDTDSVSAVQIVAISGDEISEVIIEELFDEPLSISAIKEHVEYSGERIAGTEKVPLLVFNTDDFNRALAEKTLIILHYSTNECIECEEDVEALSVAFEEFSDESLIGFLVAHDSEDEDKRTVTQEYGMTGEHTKIFLRSGEQVFSSNEVWKKEQYLTEIASVLGGE